MFGQDISGEWKGFLLQDNGGVSKSYSFIINIEKNKKKITGSTKISLWDEPNVFGEMEFSGSFSSKELIFREIKIIDENKGRYAFEWCIKTGKLKYSIEGDSAILSGDWTAITPRTCNPGFIKVKKYELNQDIVRDNDRQQIDEPQIEIEDRKIKEGIVIKVPKEEITIFVSDAAKEDGDTISLIFNDIVVLSEYKLTKEEYKLKVIYDKSKDDNTLVLYAHNIGSIPPNTAKIQIKSGKFNQEIILKSDLDESDIIHFKLK